MHACLTMKNPQMPIWPHRPHRETNMPLLFSLTIITIASGRSPLGSCWMLQSPRMSPKRASSGLQGGSEGCRIAAPSKHGCIGFAVTRHGMLSGQSALMRRNSNLRLGIWKFHVMAGMGMLRVSGLFTSCSLYLLNRERPSLWSSLRNVLTPRPHGCWDALSLLFPGASILPNAGCANS